jgi:hypothetical protein
VGESVAFELVSFATQAGGRRALVVTPTAHVRVGSDRLPQLRAAPGLGEIDALVLRHGERAGPDVRACIFRGADDDGRGSWGFAPGLDVPAQHMLVYRALLRRGVVLFLHTEFGSDEVDAFRAAAADLHAAARKLADGRNTPVSDRVVAETDAWILRNLVFFFTNRFAPIVDRVLSEKFDLMERHTQRVRDRLLAESPPPGSAPPRPSPGPALRRPR